MPSVRADSFQKVCIHEKVTIDLRNAAKELRFGAYLCLRGMFQSKRS
jgi:hypothetical protein